MEPEDIDLSTSSLWLIRAGGANGLVRPFLDDGVTGVGFGDIPNGTTIDEARLQRILSAAFIPRPEQIGEQFFCFVNDISIGDIVFMPDASTKSLVVGVITSDYEYDEFLATELCRHRRTVEWRRSIPYSLLPDRLHNLPKARNVVNEVNEGALRTLANDAFLHKIGTDPFARPEPAEDPKPKKKAAPRAPRKPKAEKKAPPPQRRCMSCLMQKPLSFFDGASDHCTDCLD